MELKREGNEVLLAPLPRLPPLLPLGGGSLVADADAAWMATSWRQYLSCHISRRRRHFQQNIILTIASSIRRNFDLSSSKRTTKAASALQQKHSWSSTPLNGWREAGGGVMLPLLTVRTVCFAIVTRIIATQTASRLDTVTSMNARAVCRCCWRRRHDGYRCRFC